MRKGDKQGIYMPPSERTGSRVHIYNYYMPPAPKGLSSTTKFQKSYISLNAVKYMKPNNYEKETWDTVLVFSGEFNCFAIMRMLIHIHLHSN